MTHTHRNLVATGFVTALSLLFSPRPAAAQDEEPDAPPETASGDTSRAYDVEEAAAWAELRAEEERARSEEDERLRESERELARASRDADDDDVYARFELTMGFVSGYASYADLGFSGTPALRSGLAPRRAHPRGASLLRAGLGRRLALRPPASSAVISRSAARSSELGNQQELAHDLASA